MSKVVTIKEMVDMLKGKKVDVSTLSDSAMIDFELRKVQIAYGEVYGYDNESDESEQKKDEGYAVDCIVIRTANGDITIPQYEREKYLEDRDCVLKIEYDAEDKMFVVGFPSGEMDALVIKESE